MNRLILVATLLSVGAVALADDPEPEKPKSTKHEGKYLNLVDAANAFKMAQQTNKRVLVYQDWPS